MKISSFLLFFLSCATSLTLCSPANAKPFSQLVEFSGALSDTGNYESTHKGVDGAPFFEGRTTNGRVAGEVLAERLDLQVINSMHLVAPARGSNFSVRDALAGANGPDDLPAEIDAYLKPRGGQADPDALYFLFNGGNDVIKSVMEPNDEKSQKILDDAVAGLEVGIRRLVSAGAHTIFAPDFVDISLVPALRNTPAAGRATRISEQYNRQFYVMLDRVQSELDFELIRWSFDDFFKQTIKHSDEFGFRNITDSCVALQKQGRCDLDHFLFVNDVFPSARFHQMMGDAMATAILDRDSVRTH